MIDVVETFDKYDVSAHISREIIDHANGKWDKGVYLILAGNHLYHELLAENENQRLKGGNIEFRNCQALEPRDALLVNLQNFEAVKLEEYNV